MIRLALILMTWSTFFGVVMSGWPSINTLIFGTVVAFLMKVTRVDQDLDKLIRYLCQ